MRHGEFIGRVQDLAQLPDTGSAERAVRATLETLAERLPDGLAEHAAAQLPHEIGEHLRRVTTDPAHPPEDRASGERFDLSGFTGRICWRTGLSESAAVRQAAAVLEVMDAALSPEQMDKVYATLPPDIRELLPEARLGNGEPPPAS